MTTASRSLATALRKARFASGVLPPSYTTPGDTIDGSAELLDDGSIEIEFAYHNGDEAVLKAKRDGSSTVC